MMFDFDDNETEKQVKQEETEIEPPLEQSLENGKLAELKTVNTNTDRREMLVDLAMRFCNMSIANT